MIKKVIFSKTEQLRTSAWYLFAKFALWHVPCDIWKLFSAESELRSRALGAKHLRESELRAGSSRRQVKPVQKITVVPELSHESQPGARKCNFLKCKK
jgi:hypothetical protein